MNRSQWISVAVAAVLVVALYTFGKTVAPQKPGQQELASQPATPAITIDSLLFHAKETLSPEQVSRITGLEHSISRGDVKDQQIKIYNQLSRFWKDSARIFEPYAWYTAEAARLENSEKSLTFAAHLFLENLRDESNPALKTWKALQAKDLFERSLKINPDNDSSNVGLGACYLFGNIADNPMEGIMKIRQVVEKDSTNVYAQITLGYGSMISGQYDKAILRFETVNRLQPGNLEAIIMAADAFTQKGDKDNAVAWYQKALSTPLINNIPNLKEEVEKRITDLKK